MRDEGRHRRPDEEEDLFQELRDELADVDAPRGGTPSLGRKGAPADDLAFGAPAGPPPPGGYPPEGFDSDEDLGRLPTLTPGTGQRPAPRRPTAPRRPPRLILAVLAVVLAAAAFLFWPRGRAQAPLGTGERASSVSAAGPATTTDVDIAQQRPQLVPEQPGGRETGAGARDAPPPQTRRAAPSTATTARPATEPAPVRPEPAPVETPPAATTTEPGQPAATAPAPDLGPQPGPEGAWLLQVGAFSSQENADALVQKLREAGLGPRQSTGSGAGGVLVYKVSIGYFLTREAAAEFGRRQARVLGGQPLPVHR